MSGMIDPSELEGGVELTVLPEGTQAQVRVISVRKAEDRHGHTYYRPLVEIVDEPYTKDFSLRLFYPPDSSYMTSKQVNQAKNQWTEFNRCFSFQPSGPYDPVEAWVGLTGWAILGIEKSEEYGDSNKVLKYIIL